jgi:hypothetical protein
MSEALRSEPGSSLWDAVPCVEITSVVTEPLLLHPHTVQDRVSRLPNSRTAWIGYPAAGAAELPTVRPGQLWYVELPAKEPAFSPLEYQVLTTANVVIYDRALAPTVAGFLPIGGYAEPAPSDGAALGRCLRFAHDGWSVARLVDPSRGRAGMIRQLTERLLRVKAPTALPVLVFANDGGRYEKSEIEIDELGDVIEARSFHQLVNLTIIFSGIDAEAAPRFTVASANGLAG